MSALARVTKASHVGSGHGAVHLCLGTFRVCLTFWVSGSLCVPNYGLMPWVCSGTHFWPPGGAFFGISEYCQTSFPSCGIVVDGEAGREELVSGNDFGNEVNGDNEEGVGTEFWATKFRRRRGGDIRLY